MNPTIRLQLSIMMFLQFFVWGAWYVTAPNYLGTIGFKAEDFGWTYSVGPIAGILSPFFVGMIADRFFAAQRVLAAMHLLGGCLMLGAAALMGPQGSSPSVINTVFFLYMLTYFPTLALTNTLAMRNMTAPDKEFPGIRVLGTIGWIAANATLSFLAWDKQIHMFYLTAGAAFALGVFSFFLPHTPPSKEGKISARQILGLDALALLRDRSYLTFMIASFLICIPLAFYYQIASRVVEMTGLPIGATMMWGQISEIFFMLIMPFFFIRLGVKWMLAVGMSAWVLRYALFSLGAPSEVASMIFVGILLHGICYDFFFVTGQIYTDQIAPKQIRAQAQGMLVLFTLGAGMFIGAQIAGRIEARHTTGASHEFGAQVVAAASQIEQLKVQLPNATGAQRGEIESQIATLETKKQELRKQELQSIEWRPLWGKPALFAAMVLALFVFLFKDGRKPARSSPSQTTASV